MKVILVLYPRSGCLNCGNHNFSFKDNKLSIEIKKLRGCLRGGKLEIWGEGGVFIRASVTLR